MATTKTKPKQSPSVPLHCSKCGGTKLRIQRATQMLQRTFRRDKGVPTRHLHARVACLNPRCHHQWWSAHETALTTVRAMEERYDKIPKPKHGVERDNWEAARKDSADHGVDYTDVATQTVADAD